VTVDGQEYEVEILDTAVEEDYQNMIDMWIGFGEGFLLVFAINDKESFELLKGKRERILKGKHQVKCPILLVGNKKDLESERQVSQDEAKSLADKWDAGYIETSAKNNDKCKEAFEMLAKQIIQTKSGTDKRSGGCCCNII
jgi:small GTP-binding protein